MIAALGPLAASLAPVLLAIAVGFLIGKKFKLPTKLIANILIFFTGPCLVFSSLVKEPLPLSKILPFGGGAALVVGLAALVTFAGMTLLRLPHRAGLTASASFMNSGFLGAPIIYSLYGPAYYPLAVIYDTVNAFLMFSLGVMIFSTKSGPAEALKQPFLYATISAVLYGRSGLPISPEVLRILHAIGWTTIPTILILLGYELSHLTIPSWTTALTGAVARFANGWMWGALIGIGIFHLTGVHLTIFMLMSIMPTAVSTIVLAERYEVDADVVASIMAAGIILSPIAIALTWLFYSGGTPR